ncbi:hypothetical protein OF83DRAFT_1130363, partial [Amylostereum chailletii]
MLEAGECLPSHWCIRLGVCGRAFSLRHAGFHLEGEDGRAGIPSLTGEMPDGAEMDKGSIPCHPDIMRW